MADEAGSMLELLIGLPNVRVLRVERINDVLEIHLETADPARFCPTCGMAGVVKDRPKVRYADLPVFGQQAVLVWHKYRWSCPGENRTWTEERPDSDNTVRRSASALTHRAAVWATIQVGRLVCPVSQIAAEINPQTFQWLKKCPPNFTRQGATWRLRRSDGVYQTYGGVGSS